MDCKRTTVCPQVFGGRREEIVDNFGLEAGGPLWALNPNGRFRQLRVPYFGVLIIRILLFRILY